MQCSGRLMLLGTLCVVALVVAGIAHSSHLMNARHAGLATWLVQHPPPKASHENELLRRQRLAALVELPPAQLAGHAPALVASLDHADAHVRKLAMAMLARLVEPASQALLARAAALAERLGSADEQVRLFVVRTLGGLGDAQTLGAAAPGLVRSLADSASAVRWAAVGALAALPPPALAGLVREACDVLRRQGDDALSAAAITSWSEKLDGRPEEMALLGGLKFSLGRKEWGEREAG